MGRNASFYVFVAAVGASCVCASLLGCAASHRDQTSAPPATAGGGLFSNPIHNYPTGWNFGLPSQWDSFACDLNGDGLDDVLRLGATYAHLFINQGNLTFSSPIQQYPTGWSFGLPSTWQTISGDFDGNGRCDYARLGGTYSHFFLSTGNGTTFTTPIQNYPAGWDFGFSAAWEPIVGDFNGDGRTDYARLGATYAHLFLSNGDGTFQTPIQSYPSGWDFGNPSSWAPIVGDFNGDGLTDYARLGATYAHLFLSNGDGTFQTPIQNYPSGWNFGLPSTWDTIVGDFDGDGAADYARLGGTYARVFLNNGNATFTNITQNYPAGWNFGFTAAWDPIVGDFNGDGRSDYARLGGTYSHVFLSNGDGTFSRPVQYYPAGWNFANPSSWTPLVGRFSRDAKTDYVRLGGTYSHFFIAR